MPYPNTVRLIEKYADKFISNTLTAADISELNELNGTYEFKRIVNYKEPSKAMTPTEGMLDFVQTIGPLIPKETLHEITKQFLVDGAKNSGENTFMRNTTLEKNLLAFELVHYPEQAEQHFKEAPITANFSESEIGNLKSVIINPPSVYFTDNKANPVVSLETLKKSGASSESQQAEEILLTDVSSLEAELQTLKEFIELTTEYPVKENALAVVEELAALKEKGKDPAVLQDIAVKTGQLLKGEMEPDAYKAFAKDIKMESSKLLPLLKVLANVIALIAVNVLTVGRAKETTANITTKIKEQIQELKKGSLDTQATRLVENKEAEEHVESDDSTPMKSM
ncbi:MAG: hypothetical protein WC785_06750 [Tatlockia sp.]|jgi:VPS inhibitor protein E